MKKTLLSIASLLIASLSFTQSHITNGSFENWDTKSLTPSPDDWETTISEAPTTNAIQRSTDAQMGTYSLRMENVLMPDGDTAMGFAVLGGINDGPGPGIPYSSVVDTLRGFYKYDIAAGDSATMFIILKSGGNMVSQALRKFTGKQNTWTPFSLGTNLPNGVTPDSLILAFASTNVDNEVGRSVGSWLMIDNISLTGPNGVGTPLPNNDFENWTIKTYDDPKGWSSFNQFLVPTGGNPNAEKVTDAAVGSFAVKLSTIVHDDDTIPGALTNGKFDLEKEEFVGGIPFTDLTDTLIGKIKFNLATGDTGGVVIEFMNNGNIIDEAFYAAAGDQNSYTDFEIGFPSTLLAIDSIRVTIYSGDIPGSVVYVDDLKFKENQINVGIDFTPLVTNFKSFPNPVVDHFNLQFDSEISGISTFEVFDINGKQVVANTITTTKGANRFEFDLSDLATGYYNYSFITKNNIVNGKLVIAD